MWPKNLQNDSRMRGTVERVNAEIARASTSGTPKTQMNSMQAFKPPEQGFKD